MFAYSAAGKLLMLPALLSYYCGPDLVFPALAIYCVQIAVVWAVAYACSKTDRTFFGMLEDTFGKVISKIFAWLFALYFAACALLPMLEQIEDTVSLCLAETVDLAVCMPRSVLVPRRQHPLPVVPDRA